VFDLEGSPSRPGSRQPLVTRPLANGAPPGAPLYPILSEPDIPAAEKKTDDVVIKISDDPVSEALPTILIAEVEASEPQPKIIVDPPEYNTEPPPAYNSHEEGKPIIEISIPMEEIKPDKSSNLESILDDEPKVEDQLEDDAKLAEPDNEKMPEIPEVVETLKMQEPAPPAELPDVQEPDEISHVELPLVLDSEEPVLAPADVQETEPLKDVKLERSPSKEPEEPALPEPCMIDIPESKDTSIVDLKVPTDSPETTPEADTPANISEPQSSDNKCEPKSPETTPEADTPANISEPKPSDDKCEPKSPEESPAPVILEACLQPEEIPLLPLESTSTAELEDPADISEPNKMIPDELPTEIMPEQMPPEENETPTPEPIVNVSQESQEPPLLPPVSPVPASPAPIHMEPSTDEPEQTSPQEVEDEADPESDEAISPESEAISPESDELDQQPSKDTFTETLAPLEGNEPSLDQSDEPTQSVFEPTPDSPTTPETLTSEPKLDEIPLPLTVPKSDAPGVSESAGPQPDSPVTEVLVSPEPTQSSLPDLVSEPVEELPESEASYPSRPSTPEPVEADTIPPEDSAIPEPDTLVTQDNSDSPVDDQPPIKPTDIDSPDTNQDKPLDLDNEAVLDNSLPIESTSVETEKEKEISPTAVEPSSKPETPEPVGSSTPVEEELPAPVELPFIPETEDLLSGEPPEDALLPEATPDDPSIHPDDIIPDLIYPDNPTETPDSQKPPSRESPQSPQPMPSDFLESIPETDEGICQPLPNPMIDSLVESVDLTLNECPDTSHPETNGSNNLKPTETPPPPYSSLPRTYDRDHPSP